MKKHFTRFSLVLMALMMFCGLQNAYAQQRTTLAGWTFPNANGTNLVAAECGSGTIYADGTHGSDEWTVVTSGTTPGIYYNNGGVAPAEALCEVVDATKALTLIGNTHNGHSIVMVTSTADYSSIAVSFNTRGTSTGFKKQTWSHSYDGENWVTDAVYTDLPTTNTAFANLCTINFPEDAANQTELYIRVTLDSASGMGNNRLDNICISGISASALNSAATPEFSLPAGNYCDAPMITITCATPGATIYYTTDGTTPDNLTGTLYTDPISITATATLSAIAYADGLDASSVKSAEYVLPTVYTSISGFLGDTENNYFKISGDLTAVYKTGSYLFVQDATAPLCIYGTGISSYANGDVISGGVCGTKGAYYGMVELTNPVFQNPTATPGTAVAPISVTIAELNSNFSNYACRLVSVNSATFQAGTFTGSVNSYLPLIQNNDTILVYNQFRNIDGLEVEASSYDVTGFAIPHDAVYRLCPRNTADVASHAATLTIDYPADGQMVEQGDAIIPAFTTTNFAFENGSMIHAELSLEGQNVSNVFIHNATELSTYTATDLATSLTGFGACQYVVSLVESNNNVIVTDTVNFTYIAAYIAIETSEETLNFSATGESHTFAVTAFRLANDITLSVSDPSFTVTPATLSATAYNDTVTVTFVGTESATAQLTLTSGNVVATVALNAVIPIDEVIYTVGFEESEEFTAGNTYNNQTIHYDGPQGQQWGTYYGTVSTNYAIADAQSMQMRWYTSAPDRLGYAFTNFNLHNVTKVEFQAKYRVQHLNVRVSRSIDGGATYGADSVYELTATAQNFTYNVSDSGQYYSVRLKFQVELPDEAPTNTSHLTIDNVTVYGVTGLAPVIVEDPVISEPSNSYITPIVVTLTCATEDATIYYTTDGTTPDETSLQYVNPFVIDSTCTLKARAFKGGMDPSGVAFAEYIFPTRVDNIAAFKAAGALDNNTTYKITGPVTFVYRSNRRIFIEDATGGLLVYDNTTPLVTRDYSEGDVITGGIIGTYTVYNGMNEMIPAADWDAATSTVTVTPMLTSSVGLVNNWNDLEARLVRLNSVTFDEGVEFTTSEITEAVANDEEGAVTFRNQFMTLDTVLPAGAGADIVGFACIFVSNGETTYQIFPRTNGDIMEITGIAEAALMNVNVFPNPTTGVINVECALQNAQCEMQVCDMLGRVLMSQQVTSENTQLDLGAYTPGMYMIRFVSTDGRTAVLKVSKR